MAWDKPINHFENTQQPKYEHAFETISVAQAEALSTSNKHKDTFHMVHAG